MRSTITIALAGAALFAVPVLAFAQTAPAEAPADAGATEAPAPKAKPKARPGSSITLANATTHTLTEVVVSSGDKTAKLAKPLGPKKRAVLKLSKFKGCTVSVTATFEGGAQSNMGEHNVCKDKTVRFTE